MVKRIAIVGCGNVGSRHLQALTKTSFPIEISIVEPNKKSHDISLKRLSEIKFNKNTHRIFWYKNISDLKGIFDLTIIATLSINRVQIIKKLLELGHKRFLIEKIVCQSNNQYKTLLKNMKKYHAKGWVNTTPRHFDIYNKIKKYFSKSNTIHLSVVAGSNDGMATNSIHYLDLFSYFVNDYKITLDGKFLHKKLLQNKRGSNLIEFAGMITGISSNGSSIMLNFLPNCSIPFIVTIRDNENRHLIIDETNERIISMTKNKLNFKFVYEHTSILTTKIATDIITNDSCQLSTLENSYYLHKELFRIFCIHVEKLTNKKTTRCLIT